ncbi:MICOS complex subunit MIC19 isoform X1 [Rhinatrema bivittatum]|uniref:MICOS complex subunit MIC19 isoform X1 n=1 Tax=Rhinatrema bivittatum TaxID=194408 RepID=UPI001129FCB2|nr:MICOS complex subunit MIC19 isoform X1 [Rhinatrema bivittatum]
MGSQLLEAAFPDFPLARGLTALPPLPLTTPSSADLSINSNGPSLSISTPPLSAPRANDRAPPRSATPKSLTHSGISTPSPAASSPGTHAASSDSRNAATPPSSSSSSQSGLLPAMLPSAHEHWKFTAAKNACDLRTVPNEQSHRNQQQKAKQLEGKDCMLKKQDEYYKEQLARLEERSTQFYKVTTDEYQKAANDVETRFKRYEVHPICAELQDKIFQCYQQNSKQSLSCSALARLYLRCVNSAKQSILGRGG